MHSGIAACLQVKQWLEASLNCINTFNLINLLIYSFYSCFVIIFVRALPSSYFIHEQELYTLFRSDFAFMPLVNFALIKTGTYSVKASPIETRTNLSMLRVTRACNPDVKVFITTRTGMSTRDITFELSAYQEAPSRVRRKRSRRGIESSLDRSQLVRRRIISVFGPSPTA